MTNTRINSDGTMAGQFKIGKFGPTIYQGSSTPNDENGSNGDLYVQIGDTPCLYVKQSSGWLVSGDPAFGFVRQEVTEAGTTPLISRTNYAGVNYTQAGTVQLMAGYSGKTVTVKDEGGTAYSNTITVIGQNGDMIDGQSSWNIDINYGFLTFVYGSSQWHIISAVTSSTINNMTL